MTDEKGQSKGFGFLTFKNPDEAEEVINICLY